VSHEGAAAAAPACWDWIDEGSSQGLRPHAIMLFCFCRDLEFLPGRKTEAIELPEATGRRPRAGDRVKPVS
jgi:hypothetical protein